MFGLIITTEKKLLRHTLRTFRAGRKQQKEAERMAHVNAQFNELIWQIALARMELTGFTIPRDPLPKPDVLSQVEQILKEQEK